MKKFIIAAAMLMTFVASSFAAPAKPFTSGIMFTSFSEIARGDDSPDFDKLMGYRLGIDLSYNAMIGIIPSLYIHPALGIAIRMGSEDDGKATNNGSFGMSVSSSDAKTVTSLDVWLPVTARYYISNIFFAELGLEFAFNILETFNTGSNREDDWYEGMYEPCLLNLGINAGLGVTLPFGLEISLNYVHGLTDLYKQHDLGPLGKTNTWSYSRINFNIGYWFGYR